MRWNGNNRRSWELSFEPKIKSMGPFYKQLFEKLCCNHNLSLKTLFQKLFFSMKKYSTVKNDHDKKSTVGMCGVVVRGEMFLFGGTGGKAYTILGCRMRPMAPMGFTYSYGICAPVDNSGFFRFKII